MPIRKYPCVCIVDGIEHHGTIGFGGPDYRAECDLGDWNGGRWSIRDPDPSEEPLLAIFLLNRSPSGARAIAHEVVVEEEG